MKIKKLKSGMSWGNYGDSKMNKSSVKSPQNSPSNKNVLADLPTMIERVVEQD